MPVTTPQIKVDAVSALRAAVVLEGDSYEEAYAHAVQLRPSDTDVLHPTTTPT